MNYIIDTIGAISTFLISYLMIAGGHLKPETHFQRFWLIVLILTLISGAIEITIKPMLKENKSYSSIAFTISLFWICPILFAYYIS